MGTATTLMPRAEVAAAAEFRSEESEVCIAAAVVEAGTVMMTVMMSTLAVSLPGATSLRRLMPIVSTVTAEVRTPASRATISWREEELTVPLTVRSSLTFSFKMGTYTGGEGCGCGGVGGVGGEGGKVQNPQLSSQALAGVKTRNCLHLLYADMGVANSALQNSGSASPHRGGGGTGGGEVSVTGGEGCGCGGDGDGGGCGGLGDARQKPQDCSQLTMKNVPTTFWQYPGSSGVFLSMHGDGGGGGEPDGDSLQTSASSSTR
eukprot:scaffold7890_cov42-Phaeocystis_antarctica.AAC.2